MTNSRPQAAPASVRLRMGSTMRCGIINTNPYRRVRRVSPDRCRAGDAAEFDRGHQGLADTSSLHHLICHLSWRTWPCSGGLTSLARQPCNTGYRCARWTVA
ncbi:hypothetical protein VFPFJ_10784 [Purpureocillium lilacinum]|uniref:Uncharacterized protein n=1 Tax=Purpureocillium lilacinum TaxID=33203 RepID=A0A179GDA4_PURLI|nr:hypothetical protein VFPFJ_10784 [Purpureocillium lilacinum]OAQ75794.1 hypothetical protein VFPFJ_10784 [Purpureocillium lilacinum]